MPILYADYSNINYEEMALSIGVKSKHIPAIIKSFFEETNTTLKALEEAIKLMDYDKIKSLAHAIKGSSGNIKFNEIFEMAKEMEQEATKKSINFDYAGYMRAIKKSISTIAL
ncbi:MAG: Hpt domain-containing protein [Sulfurimonas sp.]|uniref:Hpt domain-containing protein n=1 Tax=Sulfurimonas sp. TaxID=2022749 RepID=UPI0025D420BE|nr:Hpt domain-containing protein [Sulfurimonas sp.]MCK9455290.1 Hpt domain-containing protein [Sulfurimonas sp.]